MPAELHVRIEQILARRLRAEGHERHAALRIARQACSEILKDIEEPTREMRDAAHEACVGLVGPADYWRAMARQAAAAIPSRTAPAMGDLLTEASQ